MELKICENTCWAIRVVAVCCMFAIAIQSFSVITSSNTLKEIESKRIDFEREKLGLKK